MPDPTHMNTAAVLERRPPPGARACLYEAVLARDSSTVAIVTGITRTWLRVMGYRSSGAPGVVVVTDRRGPDGEGAQRRQRRQRV